MQGRGQKNRLSEGKMDGQVGNFPRRIGTISCLGKGGFASDVGGDRCGACGRGALVRPPCCPVRARGVETPSLASYRFPAAAPNQVMRFGRKASGKRTMPGSVRQSPPLARTGQQGSGPRYAERKDRRSRRKAWIPACAGMSAPAKALCQGGVSPPRGKPHP